MKIFILGFILLFTGCSQAQNFKFGKVSREELEENTHYIDSSANAAVLYRNEKITFIYDYDKGFIQLKKVHERIKFYNKEGFEWATKKIKLYNKSNSNDETVVKLKGYTYNLVNGKIVSEKLKKDGVFKEINNKYWKTKSFTMPGVKEGSVIEYIYEIRSPFTTIDDIIFQYSIPINNFDLYVRTSDFFEYNKLLNLRASYIPEIQETNNDKSVTFSNANSLIAIDAKSSESKLRQEYILTITTSNCVDIPTLKDEPFIDNLDNYRSKLVMELTKVNYPKKSSKNYASNWESVAKSIYENKDFGKELDKLEYFDDDLDVVVSGIEDPSKKIELIYGYVKSKVKWNGFFGTTAENGLKTAYKEGIGNVADINLMLVAMLKYAGVNANPVLLSTKSNGVSIFPTRKGFNYVICHIEDGGMQILLDAADENATLNILPVRSLNWQGRLVRNDGTSEWINLIPQNTSLSITSLNFKLNSDLSIDGKVRSQKFDYLAKDYRDKFSNSNEENYIKFLEKDAVDLTISNLEVEGDDNLLEPIKITYEYTMDNAVEDIGGKLYFSPLLFLSSSENPFKADERKFPIDLMYPITSKYLINIMLPEGYDVESLPKTQVLDFAGKTGQFKYLINQNGRLLQINLELNINTSFILPENYTFFKEFLSLAIEKESEKIVLKKI